MKRKTIIAINGIDTDLIEIDMALLTPSNSVFTWVAIYNNGTSKTCIANNWHEALGKLHTSDLVLLTKL